MGQKGLAHYHGDVFIGRGVKLGAGGYVAMAVLSLWLSKLNARGGGGGSGRVRTGGGQLLTYRSLLKQDCFLHASQHIGSCRF